MTMTKTLPWAMALHILFLGALLAAAGGTGGFGMAGGRPVAGALPSTLIISLSRGMKMAAPKATSAMPTPKVKTIAAKALPAPAPSKTKNKTMITQATIRAKPQVAVFQANPSSAPVFIFGAQPFPVPRMRPIPPPVIGLNPWIEGAILAGKETAFQSSAQKAIRKMLLEDVGELGIGALEGQKARVLISYGPDGALTGAKVSSDGPEIRLETLLKGINWAAVPLPSSCRLSLKSLALKIKVEKGTALITAFRAF